MFRRGIGVSITLFLILFSLFFFTDYQKLCSYTLQQNLPIFRSFSVLILNFYDSLIITINRYRRYWHTATSQPSELPVFRIQINPEVYREMVADVPITSKKKYFQATLYYNND